MTRKGTTRKRRRRPQPAAGAGRTTLLVFLAALAVQLVLLSAYREDPFLATPVSDALSYEVWARRIAEHGLAAEPVFHQAPLFPVALSAVFALAGEQPRLLALLGQAAAAALAVALLVPLGRLYLGRRASGVAAAGLALLHAPFAFHALKLVPVTAALVTQAAALVALGLARRRQRPATTALAGIALGVAVLARAETLLFVPLAVAALLAGPRPESWRKRLGHAALLLAGTAIAVAPATVHNLRHGDRVLVASSGGENLFIGNQRGGDGGHAALHPQAGDILSQRELARRLAEQDRGRPMRPSEVSAWWRARAFAEIRADPGAWLRLELRKLARTLAPGDPTDMYSLALERERYLPLLWLLFVPPWGLLALALPGLVLALRREPRAAWPLAAWVVLHALVLLAFFVSTRLRIPLYFFLCPFAGHALAAGWSRWREARRAGRTGAGTRRALAAAAAVIVVSAAVSALASARVPDRERVRLASVLSQQGRWDEALEVLEPALRGPAPDAVALDQAGWVLQQQGRDAEAAARYRSALGAGLPPGRQHQTWTRLGIVLDRLDRPQEAAAAHAEAVASEGANAGTWFERGLHHLRRGDPAAARTDLERAVQLDPAWPAPREALARLGAAGSAQVDQRGQDR